MRLHVHMPYAADQANGIGFKHAVVVYSLWLPQTINIIHVHRQLNNDKPYNVKSQLLSTQRRSWIPGCVAPQTLAQTASCLWIKSPPGLCIQHSFQVQVSNSLCHRLICCLPAGPQRLEPNDDDDDGGTCQSLCHQPFSSTAAAGAEQTNIQLTMHSQISDYGKAVISYQSKYWQNSIQVSAHQHHTACYSCTVLQSHQVM